jgi:DNA-binding response OmpR family regulator
MRFANAMFKKPGKKRVLLADDDPSVVKMTKCRLEHEGYDVLTATNTLRWGRTTG